MATESAGRLIWSTISACAYYNGLSLPAYGSERSARQQYAIE